MTERDHRMPTVKPSLQKTTILQNCFKFVYDLK